MRPKEALRSAVLTRIGNARWVVALALLFAGTVSAADETTPVERRTPQMRTPPSLLARLAAQPIKEAAVGELQEVGYPTFMSPHASPVAIAGDRVFVTNTPADTVDVIDRASRRVIGRVRVGVDPVGLAVRPDGKEVWVANHVSDSVSVIDSDPTSPTYLQVVATVQEFAAAGSKRKRLGKRGKATAFDEPVGVAFASDSKAYVSLSSENEIAVVNVGSRKVTRRLSISAQDPRAIAVRGNRLYVLPFESNNQTQISGCVGPLDGDLCTFDAIQHVVSNNNVLSTGIDVDIVKNPKVPDRDLYVFDTASDTLVDVVDTVGTLLYGLAVDSAGHVYVAQTDARNDVNGRAGTLKHGLAEMGNRAFLNQITRIDCDSGRCAAPRFLDLEPLPPVDPEPGEALATPFGIAISADDSTLVASAAGSNKLFTIDTATGAVLGQVAVDAVPRGIALESNARGAPELAWVLNVVSNSVSVVDVSSPRRPSVSKTIRLEDPTPRVIRRGRMAFHDAGASTTGTFSCESCHPDGHTDQLLWVLDTPACSAGGCTQIPPRTTMPVRGLRDTAPFHWDGIPGDPFGGRNTANINGGDPPNCSLSEPESCTRFLVDAGLASTMCKVETCAGGELGGAERRDMSTFLLDVPYPPAQRRRYDNVMSRTAERGFEVFHIDGIPGRGAISVCGACHRMPYWVSTNTPGTGMEAPTWRGAYDRWLILPQGRANVVDLISQAELDLGLVEQIRWGVAGSGAAPVWDMVLEGSTGFSGSFARQVTVSGQTARKRRIRKLLAALERSATEGGVVLEAEGLLLGGAEPTAVALQWIGDAYADRGDGDASFRRAELVEMAANGLFVGTFTGRSGANLAPDHPQPGIWTGGAMQVQSGPVNFPVLSEGENVLSISGRHVQPGAHVVVDGRRVEGSVTCVDGSLPDCAAEAIVVELEVPPAKAGLHFLQVQNPGGLFSNDFIFEVAGGAAVREGRAGKRKGRREGPLRERQRPQRDSR